MQSREGEEPLVLMGACDWLLWIILRAGRELHPQGSAQVALGQFGKEACLARRPYPREQRREGNLGSGYLRPFQFQQMSRQHLF